jgi:hypothetical protein
MPGAGLFGHRAGVLDAAAAAPDHADDQQPQDHGRQGQYASPEAARVITVAAIFSASVGLVVSWLI